MLGTAGLWVDSYWKADIISLARFGGVIQLISNRGECYSEIVWIWPVAESGLDFHREPVITGRSYRPRDWISRAGLALDWEVAGFGTLLAEGEYAVLMPHWFLALILAIGPAIWLFKWNKRRKLGPNACPSCAYDLTGNETGKCPECGVTSKTKAKEV